MAKEEMTGEHEKDEPYFTNKEIKHLREIMDKDTKWKWLTTTLRNFMAYVAVVLGGLILMGESLVKTVKGIVK
jgi:hypothetical protein